MKIIKKKERKIYLMKNSRNKKERNISHEN